MREGGGGGLLHLAMNRRHCHPPSRHVLPACRYAPPTEGAADEITAPRAWHFSNRSDQLDELRQEELARDAQRKQSRTKK